MTDSLAKAAGSDYERPLPVRSDCRSVVSLRAWTDVRATGESTVAGWKEAARQFVALRREEKRWESGWTAGE